MRHLTLFTRLDLHLWLAAASGVARWEPLADLAGYRPQAGDVLCGCFTVSQWEALSRLGVRCVTPRVAEHAVPDEATAQRCLDRLVLADSVAVPAPRRASLREAAPAVGGFQAGRQALLAGAWQRAARGTPAPSARWVA